MIVFDSDSAFFNYLRLERATVQDVTSPYKQEVELRVFLNILKIFFKGYFSLEEKNINNNGFKNIYLKL